MRDWGSVIIACAALCVVAAQFDSKTHVRPPQPPPSPPDSARPCSCSGVVNRELDCSNRGRSAVASKDLCAGRTTKVDLSRNNFVALPANWGVHITHVNISHNQLTALPRAPPLNVKTHSLDVSFNRISHSSDELRPLSALEKLFVTGNGLQSLGFLPSPCELRQLHANRNALRGVQGLNGCGKLTRLDLSGNPLGALPRGALAGLRKLERLALANAQVADVAAGAFADLGELEYLDLTGNKLRSLPPGLCAPLKELEKLHLDTNAISSLPQDVFTGMKKVEQILLGNNHLVTIPYGLFSGLNNLEYIGLNGNRLRTLPADAFSGLHKLERISLNSNQLDSLPPKLFSGLKSLKRIGLSSNKLTTLPTDVFSGITSLEVLDLGSNQLSALPPGLFRGFKSIKTLDLSANRLTTLRGSDLAGPKSISRLDLERNQLTAVPPFDASWPAVEATFLEDNRIADVSEAALRAWLGDGAQKRALHLGERPRLRAASLAQLRWALSDKGVATVAGEGARCACGALEKGSRRAQVSFCADVPCPGAVADWVEAVRRASAPAKG